MRVVVHARREAGEVSIWLIEVVDGEADRIERVNEMRLLHLPAAADADVRLVRAPVATTRLAVPVEKTRAGDDPVGIEQIVAGIRYVVSDDGDSGTVSGVLNETVLSSLWDTETVSVPSDRELRVVPVSTSVAPRCNKSTYRNRQGGDRWRRVRSERDNGSNDDRIDDRGRRWRRRRLLLLTGRRDNRHLRKCERVRWRRGERPNEGGGKLVVSRLRGPKSASRS